MSLKQPEKIISVDKKASIFGHLTEGEPSDSSSKTSCRGGCRVIAPAPEGGSRPAGSMWVPENMQLL